VITEDLEATALSQDGLGMTIEIDLISDFLVVVVVEKTHFVIFLGKFKIPFPVNIKGRPLFNPTFKKDLLIVIVSN